MIKQYKKMIFAAIMLLIAQSGWAYDFSAVYNGTTIYFNITSNSNNTLEVTFGYNTQNSYSGIVTIPARVNLGGDSYSVTSIGPDAFRECTHLTSVTIPNSVTSIGGRAFYGCTGLTSVTIPNSVTSIGGRAFYGCTGLTSVTIPNSVTFIGGGAFYGCTGLTSVTIPNSVTFIGSGVFSNCTGLTAINVSSGNSYYSSSNGVLFNYNQDTLICYPAGKVGSYIIPNSVVRIEDNAFTGCSGLTSVTIPNSVTSIGWYAFDGCTGLTSVTIPNSVTSIGGGAFNNVKNIVYHGSLTGSPWGALSINGFSDGIFHYNDSTKTYLLKYLGNGGNVIIPNSVTSIGGGAFQDCSGLTSVTIGNSVTSIGRTAFSGCSGLTDITFKSYNPPSFGSNSFNGVRQTVNIFVPCGRTAVYLSATNSILPPNITEMPSFTFSATSSNIQHGNVQILTQPNCTNPQAVIYATPNSGYTFRRWSDGNTDNPRTLLVTQDTALVAYFSSGQGITETESGELILYPNPASEMVTITGISNEVNILVINAMGKVVRRLDNVGDTVTFSIGDLPKGIYFVRMGNAVRKLVVE